MDEEGRIKPASRRMRGSLVASEMIVIRQSLNATGIFDC